MELRRHVAVAEPPHRADPHRRLAVLDPEVVEGGAPAVRHQPAVGDHARGEERQDRRQVRQHPGHERARRRAHPLRPRRIVGRRRPGRVAEAQVHVHAVADAPGLDQRREGHAPAQPLARRPHRLAQHRRLVGDGEARHRLRRHLELVRPVLAHHGLDRDPRLPQRPGDRLAERPLAAEARRARSPRRAARRAPAGGTRARRRPRASAPRPPAAARAPRAGSRACSTPRAGRRDAPRRRARSPRPARRRRSRSAPACPCRRRAPGRPAPRRGCRRCRRSR